MFAALKIADKVIVRTALAAAIAMMVSMTLISFYQVITRFVFEQPSTWSEVTARAINIWMIYLGLAAACRTGALMAVDTLMMRLTGRLRTTLLVLVSSITIGILLTMTWYGWDMAGRVRFQSLAGIQNPFDGGTVSISWMYAALPIGSLLAAIAVLARTVEEIHALTTGSADPAGGAAALSRPIQEV
ncbi:TRAP transporter small permease [Microbaculum sp. FT89]|uniref:TRAP transporter small permease n=1 Tax=Microbaculum sp. FT89 TaxID=3447298 RepID=UPI003F53DF80